MRSSYIQNNYGEVLMAIVDAFRPARCVELGVLDGYSTFHIAKMLKKIGHGHLDAFDIFEDCPWKHSNFEDVRNRFQEYSDIVTINKSDAFEVHKLFAFGCVDFLHVDIGNTGETVQKIIGQWDEKMVQGGVILFEGGSEERDQVEWMMKYGKALIKPELEKNKIIEEKYVFGTYLDFPSLT